jgi:hypothetical protein
MIVGVVPDTSAWFQWALFAWRDSLWGKVAISDVRSQFLAEVAVSLTPQLYITWVSPDEDVNGYARLLLAEVVGNQVLHPDTAIATTQQSGEYAAAASATRRWLARSEAPPNVTLNVRTGYFDTASRWHELPSRGLGADHCTIAPLSDSSAILVHAGQLGMGWAIAEGDRWVEEGILDTRRLAAAHPRFRFGPSGKLWLLWTEKLWVHLSWYENGRWYRGDSLRCVHPAGQTFWSAWCDASRDTVGRPVLVWGDLGVGFTFRDVGCIAFPTDSGWTSGEEIPGSDNLFLTPYVTRDRNGDVWVAWRVKRTLYNRWTHTYVHATCSVPRAAGVGRDRVVSWTLSEPAPESWWAVLRARGDGPFEEAARVRAGGGLDLSWTDTSPPAGVLRYKIRRESVDARYRWESEEGRWPAPSLRPLVLSRLGAAEQPGALELSGADAGTLELRVYDVQGRLVHRRQVQATGERQAIQLDLAGLPGAGVYFVTARDGSGRTAAPVKVVLLK